VTVDRFVIDASVVLEWVETKESPQKQRALGLYERLVKGEVAFSAPSFLLVEVINVLYWKKRNTVEEIRDFVDRVKTSGINFVDGAFSADASDELLDAVGKHEITAYDAQYVILAKKLGVKLLTFDEKLLGIKEVGAGEW